MLRQRSYYCALVNNISSKAREISDDDVSDFAFVLTTELEHRLKLRTTSGACGLGVSKDMFHVQVLRLREVSALLLLYG